MMIKIARIKLLALAIIISIILFACDANAGTTQFKIVETAAEVSETTTEIIKMNNCGGKADATQLAGRERNITVELGGSGEMGSDGIVIKGKLEAKYANANKISKSINLIAPPFTNMEFKLKWVEKTWVGFVTTQEKDGQVDYTVSVPVSVELVSSQDIGCAIVNAESTRVTPTQSSTPSNYYFVSLNNVGTFDGANLGLQPGNNNLRGVDFETGWIATTNSQGNPDSPDVISIDVGERITNPSKVYVLLQASWAVGVTGEFGMLEIVFDDGRIITEMLQPGYNIRDWSSVDIRLTSPNVQLAWEGTAWDGKTRGVVDILSIDISDQYNNAHIIRINIRDESSQRLNSPNPGIHIWGISIK